MATAANGAHPPVGSNNPGAGPNMPPRQKKPSIMARIWKWLDLDKLTCLLMVKGAIPPAIALSMYQADSVAKVYGNFGYLLAISSFLGFAILPRAKFIQNMLAHLIGVSVVASTTMLGLWSSTQARKHTTPPGRPLEGYNSSACAVCGIWLFFQLYVIASIRSSRPALMLPSIMTSVFTVVAFTTGVSLGTPALARAYVKELLYTFLSGFAIATAVSFLIIPINARKPIFGQMAGFLGLSRKLLKAVSAYLRSLEKGLGKSSGPQVGALKGITFALKMLHGKITGDIVAAKREIAYGKLDATDLTDFLRLLRKFIPALMGLASIPNVVDNLPHAHDLEHAESTETLEPSGTSDVSYTSSSDSVGSAPIVVKKTLMTEELESLAAQVATAAILAINLMDEAIEHILMLMQFSKPPGKKGAKPPADVEAKGQGTRPGDENFAAYFEKKANDLYQERRAALHARYSDDAQVQELPSFESPSKQKMEFEQQPQDEVNVDVKKQFQLVFVLYLEWFIDAANGALLDLVRFADSKKDEKPHFMFPGKKHLRQWLTMSFSTGAESDTRMTLGETTTDEALQNAAFGRRMNPEQLPPANMWERIGDRMNTIPRLLRSPHSAFGFRVACATLTIAIISYLRTSQTFAIKQRFIWAEIMIAISMVRTAGMSLYQFMLRMAGTTLAIVGCYIIWYIVDGKVPGVIVFTTIWIGLAFYIVVKKPQFIIAGIISIVTTILIIGYELQVLKIGVIAAEKTGQPYYPVYKLAGYRFAIVAVGLLVSFFWTIFPYPISEHSDIRQDLAAALHLVSSHYAITREMVHVGLATGVDPDHKQNVHKALDIARFKFWTQETQLLGRTRLNLSMQPWEVSLGSKFPKAKYAALTAVTERILTYSNVLAYAARSLSPDKDDGDLIALVESAPLTAHVASRIGVLSNCLSSGSPLPPGLEPLLRADTDVNSTDRIAVSNTLTTKTIDKPGYAAVVVMQVASTNILGDVDEVMKLVKSLVGEMSFAYKID